MHRTRRPKCLWWALVLLHLLLPGWASLVDAREVPDGPRAAHLEAADCAPSHELDCRLCNFLRTPVEVPRAVAAEPPASVARPPLRSRRATPPAGAITGQPLPRGPPTLS